MWQKYNRYLNKGFIQNLINDALNWIYKWYKLNDAETLNSRQGLKKQNLL